MQCFPLESFIHLLTLHLSRALPQGWCLQVGCGPPRCCHSELTQASLCFSALCSSLHQEQLDTGEPKIIVPQLHDKTPRALRSDSLTTPQTTGSRILMVIRLILGKLSKNVTAQVLSSFRAPGNQVCFSSLPDNLDPQQSVRTE